MFGLFSFKKNSIVPLDNEEKFIKTELFLGLNRIDGTKINEAEWEAFSETVISNVFTKGAPL